MVFSLPSVAFESIKITQSIIKTQEIPNLKMFELCCFRTTKILSNKSLENLEYEEECSFTPPKQAFWKTREPIQLLLHFLAFCIYGILQIKHRLAP